MFSFLRRRKPGGLGPVIEHRPNAGLPVGQRIYAIGDIHGKLGLLHKLHALILADMRVKAADACQIIYLGDYIDRGNDSHGVVEALMNPDPNLPPATMLRGNHEQTLLDCLDTPERLEDWRSFGGMETLLSYGVAPRLIQSRSNPAETMQAFARACEPHFVFYERLQFSVEFGGYFFCHAGIRPGVPLHLQSRHDLIWIRDEFLTSSADHGKVIVHGHTPVEQPEFRHNRINVDTGAYATRVLTAAVLETDKVRFIST